jgi:hypothetical protein
VRLPAFGAVGDSQAATTVAATANNSLLRSIVSVLRQGRSDLRQREP